MLDDFLVKILEALLQALFLLFLVNGLGELIDQFGSRLDVLFSQFLLDVVLLENGLLQRLNICLGVSHEFVDLFLLLLQSLQHHSQGLLLSVLL